jgi:hypothetical protein
MQTKFSGFTAEELSTVGFLCGVFINACSPLCMFPHFRKITYFHVLEAPKYLKKEKVKQ